MYSHLIKDLREAFCAHATFLSFTVITSPRLLHFVLPGLMTTDGVGVCIPNVGVGVPTVGVGVPTVGLGVPTVGLVVETYRSKKAEPTFAQEITYLNLPAVSGAVKVNEVLPLLPITKAV